MSFWERGESFLQIFKYNRGVSCAIVELFEFVSRKNVFIFSQQGRPKKYFVIFYKL